MGTVSPVVAPRELGMNRNISDRTAQNATRIAHWNIFIQSRRIRWLYALYESHRQAPERSGSRGRSQQPGFHPNTWATFAFSPAIKASLGVSLSSRQTHRPELLPCVPSLRGFLNPFNEPRGAFQPLLSQRCGPGDVKPGPKYLPSLHSIKQTNTQTKRRF
jgi:hypothetical protein